MRTVGRIVVAICQWIETNRTITFEQFSKCCRELLLFEENEAISRTEHLRSTMNEEEKTIFDNFVRDAGLELNGFPQDNQVHIDESLVYRIGG